MLKDNDPVRFGNVLMSCVTLLQCATLSSWHEVLYTAAYGCDKYPSLMYRNAGRVSIYE